jgi:hypothetical protein
VRYLTFLRSVHDQLKPERYLEIGVRVGNSLALSRCRSVGIDPLFEIVTELNCDLTLIRTTSDEYFARDEPLAPTGGKPFDLAFIDGLHLFEFALRDFMNTERHSSSRGVVIFDDVLPRNVDEAARDRHTRAWTGDVYVVLEVLARYRPDLTVMIVGTQPTGLLLVSGLDPGSTVLADNYDAIMAEYRRPDPQPVPAALLDRLIALDPQRVLDCELWQVLSEIGPDATPDEVRSAIAKCLQDAFGTDFAAANLMAAG